MKKIIPFLLGLYLSNMLFAQTTKINNDADADFKQAKEYFQNNQYSLAYTIFKKLVNGNHYSSIPTTIEVEAKYYSILCGLKMDDPAAEIPAQAFIELEKHVPRVQMLAYHLGEYYYRKKDFINAVTYYMRSDIANLTNREVANMKYHQGYAHFTLQQFDKAKPLLDAVRQIKSDPNYIDANYYFGFIAFYEKKYEDALSCFKIVENNPYYETIVPYYITEIYYFRGDRKNTISYGEKKIKEGKQYYDLKLKQLVGQAYFEEKEYGKALPYLEEFVEKSDRIRREDLYELSFCYYVANNWDKSIEGFKQLGGKEDSLAQNSMYLLADAYLRTNQKANARNAFLFCAANNSNQFQKEVSQFNYGKLSLELGYINEALKELQQFSLKYPNSNYLAEAKELLVVAYANTPNYKEALSLYDALTTRSENVQKVYPKILYGRAVEFINDQQLNRADELLIRTIQVPYNNQQLPFALFWRGEIAVRNNRISEAIDFFKRYLEIGRESNEITIQNARYNLGYCYLLQENYSAALAQFEQVVTTIHLQSTVIEQEAFLRSADCYFMQSNFSKANEMYSRLVELKLTNADYATYQMGIIAGANNQTQLKLNLLESVARNYPNSSLVPVSNLEIANTYLADEKFREAINPLNRVLSDRKGNSLYPQAYLKLGISYFNLDEDENALREFKTLVASYPNSEESEAAVEYIRSIFVQQQKANEFIDFMAKNGKPIAFAEADSISYKAAFIAYEKKDWESAKKLLADYLVKYPTGKYFLEANYFSAEMHISSKNFNAALPFYLAVADKAPNRYAERSALQVARIYYFDIKHYERAEVYYVKLKDIALEPENKLESMRGLLRCQYKLSKWVEALTNAQDLLAQKNIATDDRMMAMMVIAKNYQLNNDYSKATDAYKSVVALGKSEYSAEARYRIAEIYFNQNKLSDAEKAAFDVVNKVGSYDYWITKAYILLGDVYAAQKDYFNAEATYKSVYENAAIEELKKEAKSKLDQIIEEKNKSNKIDQ